MRRSPSAGFTLIEVLVSVAVVGFVTAGLATVLNGSNRANRTEQVKAKLRSDARNCLTILENSLRSAGWDPRNTGLGAVALDPDPTGTDNFIEVFADLDADGDTDGTGEAVTIRHHEGRVEWRTSSDTTQPFVPLAAGVTNDEDGDGTIEPMFTPDDPAAPTRVTIKVTTRSPEVDPTSQTYLRATLSSTVVLRGRL